MTNQKHSSFWQQKSPLCLSAEGAVCAQSPAAGAALRFLQAGAVPRRKNRLSARGKHSDRVRWTKQGAVFGAALQFSQGRSCGPQGKSAKRKRKAAGPGEMPPASGGVNLRGGGGGRRCPPGCHNSGAWPSTSGCPPHRPGPAGNRGPTARRCLPSS